MSTRTFALGALAAGALGLVAAGPAQAQQGDELALIKRAVAQAMPSAIDEKDNSELARNLLNVELGDPLSKTFNYNTVRTALFGRSAPGLAPDCQRTVTPAGDPDQGECAATAGSQDGGGEFRVLSFSKNMGLGNIKYLSRPAAPKDDAETDPGSLKIGLSDQDAYKTALNFVTVTLGVSPVEIANPPSGFALPVKSLAIASGGDGVPRAEPTVIQKVVFFPRGLILREPIKDETTGRLLTRVPAPGRAWVALVDPKPNDIDPAKRLGIQAAVVSDWIELRRNDRIDPGKAKTRGQLVDEISEEILSRNGGSLGIIAILIGLMTDPHGSHGMLLPAVQVYVSPAPRDPNEDEQAKLIGKSNTAYVLEVPLIDIEGQQVR